MENWIIWNPFKVGSKFTVSYWTTGLANIREQHSIKKWLLWRPLLWQSESPKLPNSRTLAKKRFQSLENKFSKNPEFAELYRKQINEYTDLGHAVKLANDHSLNISDITNYIPHHDVLNINKPGWVRDV